MLSDSEQNPQNFRIGTVTEQDDTSPKGTILSQTPTEGTEAIKGSAINVVVSSGAVPTQRVVTVVFDQTVDEADWTIVLEGGATATYHTTAGQAVNWQIPFTDTGVKAVLLRGPTGDHTASVNFGPDGGDITIGPITGSTPIQPPAESTPTTDPVPTPPPDGQTSTAQ